MKNYTDIDNFVLSYIRKSARLLPGTAGLLNLTVQAPFTPADLVTSLRKLAADGLIKTTGPKSIADIAQLTEAAGPLRPAHIYPNFAGWQHGDNARIFDGDRFKELKPFVDTNVALTLRGRAFLAFNKPVYNLQKIAAHNSQQTPPPRPLLPRV